MILLSHTGRAVAICLLLANPVAGAWAQSAGELSVRIRATLNNYAGERGGSHDTVVQRLVADAGNGFGFEITRRLTRRTELGFSYAGARFPRLLEPAHLSTDLSRSGEDDRSAWLHIAGVTARYYMSFGSLTSTYGHAGIATAYGVADRQILAGFGPRLGVGVSRTLSDRMLGFVELDAVFVGPGNAIDQAGSRRGADLFSYVGFGIQYRFGHATRRPEHGARLGAVYGPSDARVGLQLLYAAEMQLGTRDDDVDFQWEFGDGTVSRRAITTHSYDTPGTYTAKFTLRDRAGVQERSITTVVAPSPRPPVIRDVLILPSPAVAKEVVRFVADVNEPDSVRCSWDFGDGSASALCDALHAYDNPGEFTVRLVAENEAGTIVDTRDVAVEPGSCESPAALHPVHFGRDSIVLDAADRSMLRENVTRMFECPGYEITIYGYAAPYEKQGEKLSQARADAVRQYYVNLGLPEPRVQAVGRGMIGRVPTGLDGRQYQYAETIPIR